MVDEEGLSASERVFKKELFTMTEMVEEMFQDFQERKKHEEGGSYSKIKNEGGGDPPKPPASPSYSSSISISISTYTSTSTRKHSHSNKHKHDMPLLNLDVKFELPTYDVELNAEKLDNWVRNKLIILHDTKYL
jgi:uncharacterized protein with von Willebrand factor type A (vWA) domain